MGALGLFCLIHTAPLARMLMGGVFNPLPALFTESAYQAAATALSGIVGGVVALGFGLPRPQPPAPLPRTRVHRGLLGVRIITGITILDLAGRARVADIIAMVYVAAYALLGLAALAVTLLGWFVPSYTTFLAYSSLGVSAAVAIGALVE